MKWLVKAKEDFENQEVDFDRFEILNMLLSDEICHSDLVKKPGEDEPWLPIYSVPEITAPFKSFMEGMRFFDSKRFSKAMEAFNIAQTDPHLFSISCLFLGIIHSHRDSFEKAIFFYKECSDLKDFSALVHNNLGVCYAYEGKFHDAQREFLEVGAWKFSRFWILRLARLATDRLYPLQLSDRRLERIVLLNLDILNQLTTHEMFKYKESESKNKDKKNAEGAEKNKKQIVARHYMRPADYIEKHSLFTLMGIDKIILKKTNVYNYAMVIDPELFSDRTNICDLTNNNEARAIQLGRYSIGDELLDKGEFVAARQIFEELAEYEDFAQEALQKIRQCEKKEQKSLVEHYRAAKTAEKYKKALDILNLFKVRYPETEFFDVEKEEKLIVELLAQEDVERAKCWLDEECKRLKEMFFNTLFQRKIDIEQVYSLSGECENFLGTTNRFKAEKSNYLNNIRRNIQDLINQCQNTLKTDVENHLNESFKYESCIKYFEKIREYKEKYQRLCDEIGIDLNWYMNKIYQKYEKKYEQLKERSKRGYLQFEDIYEFILELNKMLELMPKSENLKKALDEALDIIFPGFLRQLNDGNLKEILLYADGIKKERCQGIYLLTSELNKLDNVKNSYIPGKSIGDLHDIMDSVFNFAGSKDEKIRNIIINHLKSLADFFDNQQDFTHELLVLDSLKERFGVEEQKKRRDRCILNRDIKASAPFKQKLKQIHDTYRDGAMDAMNNNLDTSLMASLIQNFPEHAATFESWHSSFGELPGTPVKKWQEETRRFFEIIKEAYSRLLLMEAENNKPGSLKQQICAAAEFIKIHPFDYLEKKPIRNIIEDILKTDVSKRTQEAKELLEKTGINDFKLFEKLVQMFDIESPLNILRHLEELKKQPLSVPLGRVIDYYYEKAKHSAVRMEFDEAVESVKTCKSDDLISALEQLKEFVEDSENAGYIDLDIKQRFSGLVRYAATSVVGKLTDLIKKSDYKEAKALSENALSGFLRKEIERNEQYRAVIRPVLILHKARAVIDESKGMICSLGDRELHSLIEELKSIVLTHPKEAAKLKNMLFEEIRQDNTIDEEQKANHLNLLET